jgi:uroporphyrinogen III methyltransferase/synthase
MGAEVDVLALYETVVEPLAEDVRQRALAADYVTFTSASTVRYYLESVGGTEALGPSTRLASIGPVTSEELRRQGLEPDVEASQHDPDGLLQALVDDAAGRRSGVRA